MLNTSSLLRRISHACFTAVALAAAIAVSACNQTISNPLAASPTPSPKAEHAGQTEGSAPAASMAALTPAAAADDCTAALSPKSKTIRGITDATIVLHVSFPKARNAAGCRWSFDSADHLPIILYGNGKVVGHKGSGAADITIGLPRSVKRSNTQKQTTVSTIFELEGPKNTLKFTLTADRWCPERNWC